MGMMHAQAQCHILHFNIRIKYRAPRAIHCSQSVLNGEDAGEPLGRLDSLSLGNESEDQAQLSGVQRERFRCAHHRHDPNLDRRWQRCPRRDDCDQVGISGG